MGELFDADRQQLGLVSDAPLWVDVVQFQTQLALIRPHAHFPTQPCPDCLDALTSAVELYTADFLAGFTLPGSPAWDEWQFFEAEALRQSFGEALQTLIAWHVSQREYAAAIPHAQRWVALDPLHEVAHRALMRLFAWNGQHAAALRQYEEAARVLGEELGVPPDEETEALFEAVRTRQLAPPKDPAPPPLLPTLPPPQRYVSERRLAVGGQGEVHLARDEVTGEQVVIKRLREGLGEGQPEQVARFLREGDILRRLRHPNIVRLLDSFDDGGRYALVMEYVPGGTLRDLIERQGPLPVERVVTIGLELADALSRAHHLGIIHRDLKPGNLLLAADGTPRLTDFGVARLERAETRLTQTGAFVGSPAYLSPEALRGETLDGRSDVWSLGVLLWEMLAGRAPFKGSHITPILVGILEEPVPTIREYRPEVPEMLAMLLERMLIKERDERLGSMRQVAAALEAIRDGEVPDLFTPTSPISPATPSGTPSTLRATTAGGRASALAAPADQHIHYTVSADGTRVAYAISGEGPPLVKASNWLSHLAFDWQSPVWRHWLEGLSREYRLIRYDERGCGLSDWDVDDMSFEAWVRDLEAVVKAAGLEQFPLLGISQGAAIAAAYAVRHPERVTHLVLYGGFARGRYHRHNTPEQLIEARTLLELIRVGWGKDHSAFRQVFASLFLPDGTPEQFRAFNELQRQSSSPENAARIVHEFSDIDVTHIVSKVSVPTLVLHAEGDLDIPIEEGRLLANLIPGARFVPLTSNNHILQEGQAAWPQFLEEVHRFLSTPSSARGRPHERVAPAPLTPPPSPEPQRDDRGEKVHPNLHNLPTPATSFVGRAQELADLSRRLAQPHTRLLTLTGPGGIGKTRLALAVAERVQMSYPDGVFFVPLAPLQSPEHLVPALADALGFRFSASGEPREQLLRYLSRKQLLLVLDNCEHLLEGVGLVAEILAAAPGVTVLATSRERLNLSGEMLYPLGGLPCPDLDTGSATADALSVVDYDAAKLLIEQARRVRPELGLDASDYRYIARICHLVDGMPLALVLAAGWLELLSVREVAEELAASLDLLESDLRDLPARHRSMRAAFDGSWQRLSPEEQQVFARLSVFRGGFTREAAQQVAGAGLRTLRTLANKSLITVGAGRRYAVHELLRQFGEERLNQVGEADQVGDRHAAYYLRAFAAQETALKGPRQLQALEEVDADLDNIRSAWQWAVAHRQPHLLVEAGWVLFLYMDTACENYWTNFPV